MTASTKRKYNSIHTNESCAKKALHFDKIINQEAIEIIKSLPSTMTCIDMSHPISDFLTPQTISFLIGLMQGTLKSKIFIFYGTGSNGKTCFTKILSKIFKCIYLQSDDFFGDDFFGDDLDFCKDIESMKPELLLMSEIDDNQLINICTNKNIKGFSVPLIIVTNTLPEINIDSESEDRQKIIIVEFNNIYSSQ